jgi:hypothetical protein
VFDFAAIKHVFQLIVTGGVPAAAAAAAAALAANSSDSATDTAAAAAAAADSRDSATAAAAADAATKLVQQTEDTTSTATATAAAGNAAALRELSPKGFCAFRSFFRLINRDSDFLRSCGSGNSGAYVHYSPGSSSTSGAALPNLLVKVAPGALVGMREVWQLALSATSPAVARGNSYTKGYHATGRLC